MSTDRIPYVTSPLFAEAEEKRSEFDLLASQWRRETRHISVISKKVSHPAYLRIMGMGRAAVPLLLEALRDQPAHWFEALRAATKTDPANASSNFSEAREAWLAWGKFNGYID